MSSSSSQPAVPASVPLQRVGDTVAHGTVGLATKADLDAVKVSIDQLKTEQQEIKSLLIQLLQSRAPPHHAAPDRETPTVPTCGLKVSEDSATNVPSETQTDVELCHSSL